LVEEKKDGIKLKEVFTFSQAAKEYNLADGSTLRRSVKDGRFREDEIQKLGNTWVVTKEGMERLYGKRRDSETTGISQRIQKAKSTKTMQSNVKRKNKDKSQER
jgi:hypothetical protein